jgi:hypothetical protein
MPCLCSMSGGRLFERRCPLLPRALPSSSPWAATTTWVGVDSVEAAASISLLQLWSVTKPAPRPSGLADSNRSRNRSKWTGKMFQIPLLAA